VKGILCIRGIRLEKSTPSIEINLWDLAPTVLEAMEISIAKDMDGQPLLFV
jgi:bisphosphoglycerate-independent phosphoglycerate mutase (AlkP superfamily)